MSLLTISKLVEKIPAIVIYGEVKSVQGLLIRVSGGNNQISVGMQCTIVATEGTRLGEIVGFEDSTVLVMPYGGLEGIRPGARVDFDLNAPYLNPCDEWMGRVLNG